MGFIPRNTVDAIKYIKAVVGLCVEIFETFQLRMR